MLIAVDAVRRLNGKARLCPTFAAITSETVKPEIIQNCRKRKAGLGSMIPWRGGGSDVLRLCSSSLHRDCRLKFRLMAQQGRCHCRRDPTCLSGALATVIGVNLRLNR
jgi:hypothetical protein